MTVGILGGGQLGRMLVLAGYPLGLRFRLFDPAPDACGGQVAALATGAYDDPAALARFADGLEVVTFEFENVPDRAAEALDPWAPVYPPPGALTVAQDRLAEKTLFRRLGIPTAEFETVGSQAELETAVRRLGLPAILKTRRLGYDGKGQRVLAQPEDVAGAWDSLGGVACILERQLAFTRELSVLAVRGRTGARACYPLVQNQHEDGILRISLAPAPDLPRGLQADAERYAGAVLDALEYVGLLAIELFEVEGTLLANELAPRVHNSGHWSIEGAECSQFENHLRAVLGLPLGSTVPRGPSAMVNLIGQTPPPAELLGLAGAHLHLYGKAPRPGRKLGHVTVVAPTSDERDRRLAEVLATVTRHSPAT